MKGQRCIVEKPVQFAGEQGKILDDNYYGSGMLLVKFDRAPQACATFHRDEVRVLPVMA